MIRILFIADDTRTLRRVALPLAGRLSEQGWRMEALAPEVSKCSAFLEGFAQVYDLPWNGHAGDLWRLPRAMSTMKRLRGLVDAGEFDLVHALSPATGLLSRFALRPRRALRFPRVLYSTPGPLGSWAERLASRWTDHLVVSDHDAYSDGLRRGIVPGHRLHLVQGLYDHAAHDRVRRQMEMLYEAALDLPSAKVRPARRAYAGASGFVPGSRAD